MNSSEPEPIYAEVLEPDEPDNPESPAIKAARHIACVGERQEVLRLLTVAECDAELYQECWGCMGFLTEPPLSLEETAQMRAWHEEEMGRG